jgi:hypothetical protein
MGQHAGAVDASSPMFGAGAGLTALQVQSDVSVQRTSGIVARDLALVPAPATAANGSFGMRVSMAIGALGRSVPFTIDFFGYGVGRDEVTLVTYSLEESFPASAVQRLGALMVSRALAHPH